jgi:cell division inhibitor SepF
MAGGIKKFFDMMFLNGDDDYIDDEYEDEEPEEPVSRSKRSFPDESSNKKKNKKSDTDDSSRYKRDFSSSNTIDRGGTGKVVPLKTTVKVTDITINKPVSFNDSNDLCDMLLKGQAVIVNLEGLDTTESQRIMDFLAGSIYAIGGKINQVSNYIFIFSPENVEVEGDLSLNIGEVPVFNNKF